MTREEIFSVWAPSNSPWTPWVKPVLFAHMPLQDYLPIGNTPIAEFSDPLDLSWAAAHDTCVVIDLPGVESIQASLRLAQVGYIPIPLFNGAPSSEAWPLVPLTVSVVDVWPIVFTLRAATGQRLAQTLPPSAPPAFLLDSARRFGVNAPGEGRFDNRSISFPTDFPSANLLLSHGIRNAILIQRFEPPPQADLAHTLLRWRQAGIDVKTLQPDGLPLRTCSIPTPSLFRSGVQRLVDAMPFKRHPLGGFGGMIPEFGAG